MAESSIKIEVTGEAATALAKLPELVRDIIADNARRLEMQEEQEREERERLDKRHAEADERRQQNIVSILGIVADLAKAWLSSREEADEPPDCEGAVDATLERLRNELCLLVSKPPRPTLPLDQALQSLRYARPEWLPPDNVGRLYAIMRYCTDLRDAGDLLDALGEDPTAHREAVKVLDGAFDLYRKRTEPGFMCMDCGDRNIDVQTHLKECKKHNERLDPASEGRPVSDIDFVIAVCSLVGLDASESLHLTDSLALALKQMSAWDGPLAWDYPDRKFDDALLTIDRYLSGPAPEHVREVLDRKDLSTGLDWLKEATLRLRYLDGKEIDYADADTRFVSSVCRLAAPDGVADESLETALRLLSTSIGALTDPEHPKNLECIAEYLNARQYHPGITDLLLRPDFKVAYEWLKSIARQYGPKQESA